MPAGHESANAGGLGQTNVSHLRFKSCVPEDEIGECLSEASLRIRANCAVRAGESPSRALFHLLPSERAREQVMIVTRRSKTADVVRYEWALPVDTAAERPHSSCRARPSHMGPLQDSGQAACVYHYH